MLKKEVNKEKIRYILHFFSVKDKNTSQVAEIVDGVYASDTVTANNVQFWFNQFRSGMSVEENDNKITKIFEADRHSNATEKSNLNNASTREARRKRIKRAHQLAEQIESRNLAQRISTAEGHAQESQEQCNERLQENIIRTRAAGERDIATVGAQEQ
ncbi:hypothetical protein TNCV_1151881 [Trichonephila clavipes]|nr:hypothetical protein TNCV_1151881 [Trichonephila clavipes]